VAELDPGPHFVVVSGHDFLEAREYTRTLDFGDPQPCGDGACAADFETWESCAEDCEAPPPPDNDLCDTATHIPPEDTQVLEGTTFAAAHDFWRHWESPDVYYTFVLGEARVVDILLETDPPWDTYLYLATGTCDALEVLHENDDLDEVGRSGLPARVLQPGTYYIIPTGWDEVSGPFTLTVAFAEPE